MTQGEFLKELERRRQIVRVEMENLTAQEADIDRKITILRQQHEALQVLIIPAALSQERKS